LCLKPFPFIRPARLPRLISGDEFKASFILSDCRPRDLLTLQFGEFDRLKSLARVRACPPRVGSAKPADFDPKPGRVSFFKTSRRSSSFKVIHSEGQGRRSFIEHQFLTAAAVVGSLL